MLAYRGCNRLSASSVMTYGVSGISRLPTGWRFLLGASLLAEHRLHAFSHEAEEAVQVHRFIRLMREIAVLFPLEDIEFHVETRSERA